MRKRIRVKRERMKKKNVGGTTKRDIGNREREEKRKKSMF